MISTSSIEYLVNYATFLADACFLLNLHLSCSLYEAHGAHRTHVRLSSFEKRPPQTYRRQALLTRPSQSALV
jgi:hypothetical protein